MSDYWNQQPPNSNQNDWYSGGGTGGDNWNNSGWTDQSIQQPYATETSNEFGFYDDPQQQQQQPATNEPNFYSSQVYTGGFFQPQTEEIGVGGRSAGGAAGFEDELPLLEELGINFDHIRQKTLSVLNPLMTPDANVINDDDLAGPLVFCLLFGGSLLLHGKVSFGFVYGIAVLGCLSLYGLLNMMSSGGISVSNTASVLGYCLLPMALLSFAGAILSLTGGLGLLAAGVAVLWSSVSASKLFVTGLDMSAQQVLVAYPCSLIYGLFALLAVF